MPTFCETGFCFTVVAVWMGKRKRELLRTDCESGAGTAAFCIGIVSVRS